MGLRFNAHEKAARRVAAEGRKFLSQGNYSRFEQELNDISGGALGLGFALALKNGMLDGAARRLMGSTLMDAAKAIEKFGKKSKNCRLTGIKSGFWRPCRARARRRISRVTASQNGGGGGSGDDDGDSDSSDPDLPWPGARAHHHKSSVIPHSKGNKHRYLNRRVSRRCWDMSERGRAA
jgi:hypothetical protein